VLRQSNKFNGAANLAIYGPDVDTTSNDDTGCGSGGGVNKSNGGLQRRPGGVKATEAARLEDMQYEKQVQASMSALAELTAHRPLLFRVAIDAKHARVSTLPLSCR